MRERFGTVEKTPVYQYTLRGGIMEASVITYGAAVTALRVPDANGRMRDVVLGHPTLDEYVNMPGNWGAVIGRVSNRIENGRFTVNGQTYLATRNHGAHCLHGGLKGFDKRIWEVCREDRDALTLSYDSPDGEEGFPGNLKVTVTYALTDDCGFRISYTAVSDADTVVNLTNHAFFNVNGAERTAAGMKLWIDADSITPVNDQMVPYNTFFAVNNTLYDFKTFRSFSGDLTAEPILGQRGYYDENFVLNGTGMRTVAKLFSEETGILMEVVTDQPGMQVYTRNPSGIALETQHFPNAMNCPDYPSVILLKNKVYRTTTTYRFSVKKPGT